MTSSEQQQQQQQPSHSPVAGESYRGVATPAATTGVAMDNEPTERELNLTLSAPPPPAAHVQ